MADLSTPGGRLRSLLGEGGRMSVNAFAEQMKDLEDRPPGSTRAMIYRYLDPDGPTPPTDFIQAAAKLLEVSPAWLAFNVGAQDPRHAEAAGVARLSGRAENYLARRITRAVDVAIMGEGVTPRPAESPVPFWAAPLAEAWLEMGVNEGAEEAIGEAIAAPLKSLLVATDGRWGYHSLDEYIMDLAPTIIRLARPRYDVGVPTENATTTTEDTDA